MNALRKVYLRSQVDAHGMASPDMTGILTPMQARRASPLMKRALWASVNALAAAGVDMPDAIVTATDYGCLKESLAFLKGVTAKGDSPGEGMHPSDFMQSTHNTLGSLIGIHLKCHGGNVTYSHRGASMDAALCDAWMQIALGEAEHVLVGWYDDTAPLHDTLPAEHVPWPRTDIAMALVLSAKKEGSLREWNPSHFPQPFPNHPNYADYA